MSDTSLQNAIVKALDELNKELTLLRDSVNVRQFEKGTSIAKPQFDIKPYRYIAQLLKSSKQFW